MSAAGGALMGSMLSPMGSWAQNKTYNAIRKKNGFVTPASTNDGNTYEVFSDNGKEFYGVDNKGEHKTIDKESVDDVVRMNLSQFEQMKKQVQSGIDFIKQKGEQAQQQQQEQDYYSEGIKP